MLFLEGGSKPIIFTYSYSLLEQKNARRCSFRIPSFGMHSPVMKCRPE
jgi:hypothetical protein